jgi:ELWxxDGT repeat protein
MDFSSRLLVIALLLPFLSTFSVDYIHAAPVPVLVKDINTQIKDNSSIDDLAAVGSTLYFSAWDRAHGDELWLSDGTSAGTAMVKDIRPGPTGSIWAGGKFLTYWNGSAYFKAYGPNGWSLWKSDGTSAGTVEVSHKADPSNIVVFKGVLYFCRDSFGLWKSDGTDVGTVAVKEGIGTIIELVVAGTERLYFTHGSDLWTSDGTTDGTVLLKNGISPSKLTVVGSTLFFRGWDSVNGYELWRSDGTAAGSKIVQDLRPGDGSTLPDYLVNMNGVLYFAANYPTSSPSLWKCSTTGLPEQVISNSPSNLFPIGSTLFFRSGTGLWKSDGTTANTAEVKPGVNPDIRMANVNGTLFFRGADASHGNELWKSDGTPAGTVMVKDINPVGSGASNPDNLTNLNGTLYFTATEPATGTQLWKSNGTEAGTVLVQNVSPGTLDALPANFVDVNGILYFAGRDSTNSIKLWQSNGTAAATALVPGATGLNPVPLVNGGGTLYFAANTDDLWKRVGTNSAELVMANVSRTDPTKSIYINGTLYFYGWDSAHGNELWKSDGTSAGTVMVKDINPGTGASAISNLTNLNGVLYFIASNGTDTLLWTSNGSEAGTVPIRSADIKLVRDLTLVNGKLFFLADDPDNPNAGVDFWVSDGTPGGSVILRKEHPAINLTPVGNTLFYSIDNEIWKSDGVTVTPVADFGGNIGYSVPSNLTNVNGALYFAIKHAVGTDHFIEIWKSNGVPAGTGIVKSFLNPNYNLNLTTMKFTSVHGLLSFVYDDGVHGEELWTCDGSDAGTTMVKDLYSDTSGFGSSPKNLTMANTPPNGVDKEALFFSAIDQTAGEELYILDFTPPVSAITSPANGAYLRGSSITITGTSGDSMPGSGVNLVEVSTDGSTWHNVTNTSAGIPWATWHYTWTLPVDGVYTIRSRATDLATNVQTPLASITVTVDNTKPVVNFSISASVLHVINVLMAYTFNVTEANPDVYCINSVNSPAGCTWNLGNNISYVLTTEGNYTFYAWARDKAGNVSDLTGASFDSIVVSLPHTLNIDFSNGSGGSGSVYYQQKGASYNVNAAVNPVYSYESVNLQANPTEFSLFGGWTGICNSQSAACSYQMPTVLAGGATQTATATFNFDSGHAVYVSPNYFGSILSAYNASTTVGGSEIRIFGTSFSEDLLLDNGKSVTLTGGDNQAHNDNSGGMTTVQGMTIQSGAVTVDRITIR